MGTLETVEQLKAARAGLGLTRGELASLAGVSPETIKRIEGQSGLIGGHMQTIRALSDAMTALGIEFITANGGGAGVRFSAKAPGEAGEVVE